MTDTLDYYNINAETFAEGTVMVDFSATQNRFLEKLEKNALILDFGCGSGRDTKYFLKKGFQVEAVDGSPRLCELAREHTGINVKEMFFQDLSEVEKYDGIWACASILHLPKEELRIVFRKMITALKKDGIIYASFKQGDFEGVRNGRYFIDFTMDTFKIFLKDMANISIEEYWITGDVRPGRDTEKWLNLILRKKKDDI